MECAEGCKLETCHTHSPSQIVKKSAVTAPGIFIQNKEGRQAGRLSSTFGNPIATSIEVKREATDQGMLIFLSSKNIFCALFAVRQKEYP